MTRFRDSAESFGMLLIPLCLFVAVISVIGLIAETVGIIQQTPVQRGIDAHTVRVTATYSSFDKRGKFSDDVYTLSYLYNDQVYSTPLRGLPGNPRIGAELCAEIDATTPTNGRVCGTTGGLGDAQSGLIWGGSFLTGALLILFLTTQSWRWSAPRPSRSRPAARKRPARKR